MVSIDEFKKAFAGKASPDLVSQHELQVATALRDFKQKVDTVAMDPATAEEFRKQLVGLVGRYDKVKKSNRPVKDLLSEFKDIRQQAESKAGEVKRSTLQAAAEPKYATGLDIEPEPKYATGLDIKENEESGNGAAAEPVIGMSRPFEISATVGRGGKNLEEDVSAVQAALNRRASAGLPVDGKCGPKTIKAIMEFQKALGQSRPDGRVDPGRGTARALAASGKIGPPPAAPSPLPPPDLGVPTLERAPAVWDGTRHILDHNIKELKRAIGQEYANEHPQVLREIDDNVKRVDVILEKLDRRLADTLERANTAKDDGTRAAELKNAKAILTEYIRYVKDETLIGHVDKNPFGVDTNVRKVITDSLKHMGKSIG